MAYTNNAAPSNPGLKQGGSDAYELFLKVFSGEVITSFNESNVMMPLHRVRTITSGKSAQFPITGAVSAKYHVPGQSLIEGDNSYLQDVKTTEKVISIDSMLVSPIFISDIQEAMNHYDIRGIYSSELGKALARKFDATVLQVLALGAQASAPLTSGPTTRGNYAGGTVLNRGATLLTDGDAIVTAIKDAALKMDQNDVPDSDRYIVLKPDLYRLVADDSTKAVNKFYTSGSNGGVDSGKVAEVHGIKLVKSNNMPSGVVSAETGANNTYNGTFTNYQALAFHREAVGTVKLLDMFMKSEYQVERLGELIVGGYAMGHGFLRQGAIVAITSA